ncbi:MAG TPA: PRC-barrel domain-containing protein [Burkholderiaceae bacterium]|nr:PRC-barrel domain-containing protein [Burkholderiaceae bacterium]
MKRLLRLISLAFCAVTLLGTAAAQDTSRTTRNTESVGQAGDNKVPADLNRATKVIGTDVVDAQGKEIGEVKDIVLDRSSGRVAYAVVSFGGVMGVGDKYFAIPWSALKAGTDEKLVLNVDKEKMKNAPGFDKNRWPDMASAKWNSDTYRYYGEQPYWEQSTGSSGDSDSSAMERKERLEKDNGAAKSDRD